LISAISAEDVLTTAMMEKTPRISVLRPDGLYGVGLADIAGSLL